MSAKKIKVLVATNHLNKVGGTETYTYTLIEELKKRKNIVVDYFTLIKGEVSDKIENELRVSFFQEKKYDLILANHNTVVEKIYKYGFTIQTCHGIFPKLEQPSKFADFFVSISDEVKKHLYTLGYDSELILNGINVDRFSPKKKINHEVRTVLSLCQSDLANNKIKICCKQLGVEFIKANKFENPVWEIEELINQADIVIGLGRSAYEAMSCGRPVIVFDDRPYFDSVGDGYVKENIENSILFNCSGRYLNKKFSSDDLMVEFLKYDCKDGAFFRDFALEHLNIKNVVDAYLNFIPRITVFVHFKKKLNTLLIKRVKMKNKLIQVSKKTIKKIFY